MEFKYTKYKSFYTADFETSTEAWGIDKARVWLWDICDINYNHYNGTNIESFIASISGFNNCLFSFHNLSYDGAYILSYLLDNGFVYNPNKKLHRGEFNTIITPQGIHYAYQIVFFNGNTITINDSLKHNSMSVRELAKIYNLPIQKGEIDYDLVREIGHIPTKDELTYINYDTEIMMRVLKEDLEDGFVSFTESGNSKLFFKKSIKDAFKCDYDEIFPSLTDDEDNFVRRAYRGGYCYLNPKHFNKELKNLISLDINSMYPAVMLHKPLPYGNGIRVNGNALESKEYKKLKEENNGNSYPVFIQHFKARFKKKNNRVPTVAYKSFGRFNSICPYMDDSGVELFDFYMTSVDMELFFENYKVWDIEYIDAILYRTITGIEITQEQAKTMELDDIIKEDGKGSLYYPYMYPWRYQKEHTKGGKRAKAKKQQNMAYGWQATSRSGDLCEPYINERGILSFKRYSGEKRKGGYIPIATFITAWARKLLIDNIIKNFDRFVYCDTDSLYLLGKELPNIPIHKSLYGYFKLEHHISKAKFLGAKRYLYTSNIFDRYAATRKLNARPNKTILLNKFCKPIDRLIVKCCGAPTGVIKQMNFDNFVPYNKETGEGEFHGKLANRYVVGGKHLIETTYRLVC